MSMDHTSMKPVSDNGGGKVLILEDEDSIRSFVVVNLKRSGYQVIEADNGDDALQLLREDLTIDIALLDVMVPGIDGFEVCRLVREFNEKIGILFLTAKVQEQDKVMGLSLGADDHMGKPFSPAELMARVQSLMRRVRLVKAGSNHGDSIVSGPFELHPKTNQLFKRDERIELTPTEFALIRLLMERRKVPVSRDQLLDEIWGVNYVGDPKIVDVNIRRVRQKIEEDPSNPEYVEAIWGYGYMWKENGV
ncbi:MAG: two component transcriptional regulator, winged helix family [Paenibacillus sp.]|nr:two component transcriptional regulator, winged helix family [Paenibacillus sp.]